MADRAMAGSFMKLHTEEYEEAKTPEHWQVTWDVNLLRPADSLEKDRSEHRQLALK